MEDEEPVTKALLKAQLDAFEARFEAKMDAKFDYFAKKIVDDISEVLNDMMAQIDNRFKHLEAVVFRPNFRR